MCNTCSVSINDIVIVDKPGMSSDSITHVHQERKYLKKF